MRVCFTDNKAAVLAALSAQLGVVKDAIEEIEQVDTHEWGKKISGTRL